MTNQQRIDRLKALQIEVENLLERLLEPGIGFVVVLTETRGRGNGPTLSCLVTGGVADHSVPDVLEHALKSAREQL